MAKLSIEEINAKYPDVLQEIGNIGAGNAATAIATMLNMKVDISVPKVSLLKVEDIVTFLGKEDDIIVGIMLGIEMDIEGSMMFLLDLPSAHKLVNRMMMRDADYNEDFDEMDYSAIKEIGNIIAGSYLNAIAGMTNLAISPTVPFVAVDMAAAILSVPAVTFGMQGDYALLIKTEINDDNGVINGHFILMPEGESYEKILSSFGFPI